MKSAETWIGDLRGDGHTDLVLADVKDIRAIQADCLRHAAEMVLENKGDEGHLIANLDAEATKLEKHD